MKPKLMMKWNPKKNGKKVLMKLESSVMKRKSMDPLLVKSREGEEGIFGSKLCYRLLKFSLNRSRSV